MKKYVLCLFMLISLLFGCYASNHYENENNWAYYEIGENKKADLFLIAPTVCLGEKDKFNMSIDDAESKKNFLSALNMECEI